MLLRHSIIVLIVSFWFASSFKVLKSSLPAKNHRLIPTRLSFSFIDEISQASHAITNIFQGSSNVVETSEGSSELSALGKDFLVFLCATIGIVPLFKQLKTSPVIGFLAAGLIMGPSGLRLFSDLGDLQVLADFGVLFLLFEQGLELTVDRLQKLSRYAFGMGSLQIVLSTIAFSIFPFVGGVQFLETFIHSNPDLVDITRVDEAIIIGAALSLSSSAFVLKILQEKNQMSSQFGAACLGILLMQDIAVVPLLALLPIVENNAGPIPLEAQVAILAGTFLKAILGIGGILVIGGALVRYLFSLVAQTRSSETFIALCLLVAIGTGELTETLGLSSTLGSFTAGTLLASSNYRTQIESDIKPFRGLLLGLFFITTGATVELGVLLEEWPTVLALLVGLLSFKATIMTAVARLLGLTTSDSIRTGVILRYLLCNVFE
jgi:Kef-type K+ transport system membrane component KefB